MKKIIILSLILVLFSSYLFAQEKTEHEHIETVIHQLFDGMRNADSAAVSKLLHPDLVLQSVFYTKDGVSKLTSEKAQGWLDVIAAYPAGTLDERLYSMVIEVDDNLATAWTEYSFFFGKNLSHCGTNAFQLFKSEQGWL